MHRFVAVGLVALSIAIAGCAHHFPVAENSSVGTVALADDSGRLARFSPVFVVYDDDHAFNRIGRPEAFVDSLGNEDIRVAPSPAVYYMAERPFTTDRGTYTNLIYRVHFPEIPYRLVPFNLSAGKNVGLMVLITLDPQERPVLITTVHTCGCYLAITPTDALSPSAYPENWENGPVNVYGEILPGRLAFAGVEHPKLVIHLRPEVHRVMHLEVMSASQLPADTVHAKAGSLAALEQLPAGTATTSLYHDSGLMKGHVKGALKPLETLLLGLVSLDYAVGADKAYADTARTGNPFYTSLKFWNRTASDMWYFDRFLSFWGWRL